MKYQNYHGNNIYINKIDVCICLIYTPARFSASQTPQVTYSKAQKIKELDIDCRNSIKLIETF